MADLVDPSAPIDPLRERAFEISAAPDMVRAVPSRSSSTPGRKRKLTAPHDLQLPSGRHGLSRDYVVANQRERIMIAMAEVIESYGYAGSSVERVAARAGISRRTFYEQFDGKDNAYLQIYDQLAGGLLARVTAAGGDADPGNKRWLRRCLTALLAHLAGDPAFARLCLVDVLAAGPEAIAYRDRYLRAFAELVERLATERNGRPLAPLTAEALVGAIYDVLYNRIAQGRADELLDLADDLHSFCLTVLQSPRASAP
jgi:AcrR family transcriptional regulator